MDVTSAWKSFKAGQKLLPIEVPKAGWREASKHKPLDAMIFTSPKVTAKLPAQLLFHTSGGAHDWKELDESDRITGGFRKVHEIGGRGCEYLRHPGGGTLLTRNATAYSGAHKEKQAVDLQENRAVALDLKLQASASQSQVPPLQDLQFSTYSKDFQASSPADFRAAKQKLKIPRHSRFHPSNELMETESSYQAAHTMLSSEISTSFEKTWPNHCIEGFGNGSAAWETSYGKSFGRAKARTKRPRRMEASHIDAFFGESMRRCQSAPSGPLVLPIGLIGSNSCLQRKNEKGLSMNK